MLSEQQDGWTLMVRAASDIIIMMVDDCADSGGTEKVRYSGCMDSIIQSSFLEFFTAKLAIAQPKDDYRERIEFSMIFLGQAPHRGIHFQASKPMHLAHWMSRP